MEGGQLSALDIALEYIQQNNLIEERHILLRARLVCRSWRTCRTFYMKITDATLYTLADVRLAADFFPRTPCQRLPWQTAEESRVFPSVKTLRISESLSPQLYESAASREQLALLQEMDVDISVSEWKSRHESHFHTIAGIASSLQLIQSRHSEPVTSFFNTVNLGNLTRLTKVSFQTHHIPLLSFPIASLNALSQVSSLRYLQLSSMPTNSFYKLAECLSHCAALSQLSRLDISGNPGDGLCGSLEVMDHLVNAYAPPTLRDFDMWLYIDGISRYDSCCLHTTWTNGLLKTEKAACRIMARTPDDIDYKAPRQLARLARYGVLSPLFCIELTGVVTQPHLVIDLTEAASFHGLVLSFEAAREVAKSQTECIAPILMRQPAVPLRALKFQFGAYGLRFLDLTSMLEQLPEVFPNLQQLQLHAHQSVSPYQQYLCQLTRLTHLTVKIETVDSIPELPVCLPASLKELQMNVEEMRFFIFTDFPCLTKLKVTCVNYHSPPDSLLPLLRCQAPVRVLNLRLRVDASILVGSFPEIETLKVELNSFDLCPLSSFQHLRRLRVTLPNSAKGSVTGADTLTGLASLEVKNASPCLDHLSDLIKLSRLRHLKYFINEELESRSEVGSESTSGWESDRCKLEHLRETCREPLKQLKTKMPHTDIHMHLGWDGERMRDSEIHC